VDVFLVEDVTLIRFVTLPVPAISVAFASRAAFSSEVCTGPFNVTWPSRVITLMLCAYVVSDLSATNAWRIFYVRSRSALLLPCWSAVFAELVRSRVLTFVLSGGVCDAVCARTPAGAMMSAARAIAATVSRQFTDVLSLATCDMDEPLSFAVLCATTRH